ncbi:MAG: hypothetical protein IJ088_14070 [Clostridia bacterium]|nr:hypothetical protein [Clostridia bacterium]
MACIVYRKDDSGRVYAYSSESFWDPEKKQPRSKRTYLGRVNPETGEIMKGRQNGKNYKAKRVATDCATPDADRQKLLDLLDVRNAEIVELKQSIQALQNRIETMSRSFRKIAEIAANAVGD